MALVYGQSGNISVTLAGPFAIGGGVAAKIAEIVLPASAWKNGESPYYQDIVVDGISVNSIVDLLPSVEQIIALHHTALTAVNTEGAVTVYAIGDKPGSDITIQAALTEVVAE
jgi:hypothetical protein